MAQVPGPVTSVSAYARTLVVLKIYNPVRAYGATGFKSRSYRPGTDSILSAEIKGAGSGCREDEGRRTIGVVDRDALARSL